jgi:hypothetical protein
VEQEMRTVFNSLIFAWALASVGALAETVTVQAIDPDNSKNVVLKKIDQKVGNRLRVVVIDREGHEQHISISSEDAIEIKRGLWLIRPGIYQIEI